MFASTLYKETPCPDPTCNRGTVCHFSHDADKNLAYLHRMLVDLMVPTSKSQSSDHLPELHSEREAKRRRIDDDLEDPDATSEDSISYDDTLSNNIEYEDNNDEEYVPAFVDPPPVRIKDSSQGSSFNRGLVESLIKSLATPPPVVNSGFNRVAEQQTSSYVPPSKPITVKKAPKPTTSTTKNVPTTTSAVTKQLATKESVFSIKPGVAGKTATTTTTKPAKTKTIDKALSSAPKKPKTPGTAKTPGTVKPKPGTPTAATTANTTKPAVSKPSLPTAKPSPPITSRPIPPITKPTATTTKPIPPTLSGAKPGAKPGALIATRPVAGAKPPATSATTKPQTPATLFALGTGLGQTAQNANIAGAVVGNKTFVGGLTAAEYPTIKFELRPKVPRTVRQTFLDKTLLLFLAKFPQNKKKAIDAAVQAEQEVIDQAATKNIYVNLFSIKLKKLFPDHNT